MALHFMWYNFGRVHQTLRVTPALEAGISDHVWTLAEVVALSDEMIRRSVEGQKNEGRLGGDVLGDPP